MKLEDAPKHKKCGGAPTPVSARNFTTKPPRLSSPNLPGRPHKIFVPKLCIFVQSVHFPTLGLCSIIYL